MTRFAALPIFLLAGLLLADSPLAAQTGGKKKDKETEKPKAKAKAKDDQEVGGGEFPREWFFQNPEQWARHADLLKKPMPRLDLADWMNGEVDLKKGLVGNVVVVDFWATWCGPCLKSIPHNNELVEKHKKDGLVFIGICGSDHGQEKMADVVASNQIHYPVAKDAKQKSAKEFSVQFWPTYAVMDRTGKLRAIGLKPDNLGAVIEKLLKEPGQGVPAKGTDKDKEKGDKEKEGAAGKDSKEAKEKT